MLAYEVVSYFYGESVKYYHILTIFTVRAKIYVNIEGKGILFMKVCNITAIKQAPYIPKDENNKTEDGAQKPNEPAPTVIDRIEINSEKREQIRNLLINDKRYQQIQFNEREKKYPISRRFNRYGGWDMRDSSIEQMEQNFWASVEEIATDFMEGKVTIDDVMNHFCDIADEAFETYTQKGYMGEFDSEKTALLNHLYEDFRYSINSAANRKNSNEGKQYCEFGSQGYTYYNSDYYYKAKELTDALEEEVNFVAEERGMENYTAPTDLKGYYKDLNTFKFDTHGLIKGMIDVTKEPPKDFKFFCQESSYHIPENLYYEQGEDGKWYNKNPSNHFYGCVVKIWSGDWYGQEKIPFKGNLNDIKNVADVFQNHNVPKSIKNYLSNLQIFSLASESLTYWKSKY